MVESTLILGIERHRAAIVRTDVSRPVRLALETDLFSEGTTFFDYGCGHGGDIARIAKLGYTSCGWDPYYRPDTPRTSADIVNLGYVINVIEDPAERRESLIKAWELTNKVLIVAAQVLINDRSNAQIAYGDGIVTRHNTFQKYYEQEELKSYIDQVLSVEAIPISLGIYFVFRDEQARESFRVAWFRSRLFAPKIRVNLTRYEDYKELLEPLIAFVTKRGRLPVRGEFSAEGEVRAEFGTFQRAFQVILQVTDQKEWDAISQKRREDILVYLALSKFNDGPQFRKLVTEFQNDIKALFGTYRLAGEIAESMLFSLREPGAVAKQCQLSKIGKRLPNALYVHVSALAELDPLLRLYEGCASNTIGRMEDATLIKFPTNKPKISYLCYPDFDTDPHPALQTSMQIDLQNLDVSYRDYDTSENPPVLHRKETFVTPQYPLYEKFAKLTKQEEEWGLLDNTRSIGTRKGWQKCLAEHCAEIRGHGVFWRKDADPYRVKVLTSARRARKSKSPSADG